MKRRFILLVAIAVAGTIVVPLRSTNWALAASNPALTLNVENAAPRRVEDTTQRAVNRDYSAAWQTLGQAFEQNRADLLATNFIGTAGEKLADAIAEQRQSGIHQRFTDKGHTVEAVFYSPEGSAMELHDTAQLHIDVLDGSKVIHSEDATIHYVVLLTAAESSWKIRVLEAVPAF